jgi:hypothetical protein
MDIQLQLFSDEESEFLELLGKENKTSEEELIIQKEIDRLKSRDDNDYIKDSLEFSLNLNMGTLINVNIEKLQEIYTSYAIGVKLEFSSSGESKQKFIYIPLKTMIWIYSEMACEDINEHKNRDFDEDMRYVFEIIWTTFADQYLVELGDGFKYELVDIFDASYYTFDNELLYFNIEYEAKNYKVFITDKKSEFIDKSDKLLNDVKQLKITLQNTQSFLRENVSNELYGEPEKNKKNFNNINKIINKLLKLLDEQIKGKTQVVSLKEEPNKDIVNFLKDLQKMLES